MSIVFYKNLMIINCNIKCPLFSNHFFYTSKELLYPNIALGRLFIQSSIFCMNSSEIVVITVPFGMNLRINLLLFSLLPRSPEQYGCA